MNNVFKRPELDRMSEFRAWLSIAFFVNKTLSGAIKKPGTFYRSGQGRSSDQ
jgi:hypothetical protein